MLYINEKGQLFTLIGFNYQNLKVSFIKVFNDLCLTFTYSTNILKQ